MTAAAGTAVVSWAHVGGTGHHSLVGRQALGLVCRPPSAAEGPRLLSSPPPAPKAHCSTTFAQVILKQNSEEPPLRSPRLRHVYC